MVRWIAIGIDEIRMLESFFCVSSQLTKQDVFFRTKFFLFFQQFQQFTRFTYDHKIPIDYDLLDSKWNDVLDAHECRQDFYTLWSAVGTYIDSQCTQECHKFLDNARHAQIESFVRWTNENKQQLKSVLNIVNTDEQYRLAQQIRTSGDNILSHMESLFEAEAGIELYEKFGFLSEKFFKTALLEFEKSLVLRSSHVSLMRMVSEISQIYYEAAHNYIVKRLGKYPGPIFSMCDGVLVLNRVSESLFNK